MPLRSIFDLAVGTAASPAAPAAVSGHADSQEEEQKEIEKIPEDLREKFRGYLEKLKTTIYFKDIEPNTPAWSKRLGKAREKFMRKYGPPPPERNPELAEERKNQGNELLKAGDYTGAERLYTEAISLNSEKATYFSNRAAARQYMSKHELALDDAQQAAKLDPKFTKAFMRIGHSLVALGQPDRAVREGFEEALKLQPGDAAALEAIENAKKQTETAGDLFNNPAIRQMAEQVQQNGGLGGLGGGAGGMPNMAEMLQNPALMEMAANAMQDPNMQNIMQSPMFQNMAQQAAQNPEMLRNMMSGMGGAPPANPPSE
jgi:small glutamine-rich tetratricopeptide repeat-containing protein alpha